MTILEQSADTRTRPVGIPRTQTTIVSIVGLGYVGLPTAASLTARGVTVVGVDINYARLNDIRSGDADVLAIDSRRTAEALQEGLLTLTADIADAKLASAILICVPTPVDDSLAPDVRALRAACEAVVANAVAGQTIILSSTSYVGSTREFLIEPLTRRGFVIGEDIFVAYSPERIDPGNIEYPQDEVPRVVGGATPACGARAAAVIELVGCRVHHVSSPEVAELTKLHENIFRAVNITLANEMADVGTALGIDIGEVIDAAATKPYGFMAFRPGAGAGGHCIPCDPHYLLWQLQRLRHDAPVLDQAMRSLATRPRDVVSQAVERASVVGLAIRGARVLIAGIAYKPGVSDGRESPGREIFERFAGLGAEVEYLDPLIPRFIRSNGVVMESVVAAASDPYDIVVVCTLHPGFDYGWLTEARVVVDPADQLGRRRPAGMEASSHSEPLPPPQLVESLETHGQGGALRRRVAEALLGRLDDADDSAAAAG